MSSSIPAPPALPRSKVCSLLTLQKNDGSWDLTPELAKIVGRKPLQIKAAAQTARRKLNDRELSLPFPETDNVVQLFTTMVAVEIIKRKITDTDKREASFRSNWEQIAEQYIKPRAIQHKEHIQSFVIPLLEGNRSTGTQICRICKTTRPAVLKHCPTCYNNSKELPKSISRDEYTMDMTIKPSSIEKINWESIKGCKWIAGGLGSFGVVVVEVETGLLIGKCPGNRYIHEYLGYKLAKYLGLRTPATRIVERESPEGIAFLKGIANAPFTSTEDAQRIGKYNLYPIFFVMEYVPADSSLIVYHDKAIELLHEPTFIVQLSKMIAVDILLNNYDRIPAVWNNEGNPENVLLQQQDGRTQLVCIDQIVTEIHNSFYQKYEKSIEQFITACKSVNSSHIMNDTARVALKRLKDFFLCNLQVELEDEHLLEFSKHILHELHAMCQIVTSLTLEELLADTNEHTRAMLVGDTNFDFISSVAESCLRMLE